MPFPVSVEHTLYETAAQDSCDDDAQQRDQLRYAASHGHAVSNSGGRYSDEADSAAPEGPPGFSSSSRSQVIIVLVRSYQQASCTSQGLARESGHTRT